MRNLQLSDELSLPVDAVTETFALLAIRGAGKTNTARVMAEEFFASKVPFVAIDPVGAWWGLRSSRDGKSPGLPIPIFGGRHGDVSIDKNGGVILADLIVDSRLSCVVDVSELDSEGARGKFLLAFAKRLYERNTEPLHLFMEEADDYIPQKPMKDDLKLLRAWENIVRRGRGRGLGLTLITQRSAVLNKNVLTQVGTLIAMRTTSPQDRDAVEAWLKHHAQSREIIDSLPTLKDGEAWVWSPQFLEKTICTRFRLSHTYDSGETPKLRRSRRAPATLADVDLAQIRTAMAAVVEEAAKNDPAVLRARVEELEDEVAELRAHVPEPEVKVVERPIVLKGHLEQLQSIATEADELGQELRSQSETLGKLADRFESQVTEIMEEVSAVEAFEPPDPVPAPRRQTAIGPRSPPVVDPTLRDARPVIDGKRRNGVTREAATGDQFRALPKGARAIMEAIASFRGNLTRSQVATLAGLSPNSGTFSNYLSMLRTGGRISDAFEGDIIALTKQGIAETAHVSATPRTREAIRSLWAAKFPLGARNMLDAILATNRAVSREELASAVGMSPDSGTFSNYVSILKTNGLATVTRGGVEPGSVFKLVRR